jgi:hypothetical protein
MKRKAVTVCVFVLTASMLCFSRHEDSLPQLMAKADAAPARQQSDLCMEVAERELKLTIQAFKANNSAEGRSSLQQIVKYADKGRAAAIQSGKRLKHTEIKIREIAERLRDLQFNVDVDNQPLVQATVDKLEDFRTEILKSMFGSKNND